MEHTATRKIEAQSEARSGARSDGLAATPVRQPRRRTLPLVLIVARREATEMWRDGRFRVAAVIVLALLAVSLVTGARRYADIREQHGRAQRETRAQWLAQTPKNPHSAAHYGVYAFKPTLLPSLIDQGVEPYVGVAAFLEPHRQNDFRFRQAEDATAMARFGELTAAVTLQILVPLLIILLTFASIAGEREDGTLRQVLSTGVTPRVLIAGKAIGATWALAVLLVPASVLGSAALLLVSIDGAFAASLLRLALMSASYLLYFSVFLALSLAVSTLASTGRAALVILLAFWIVGGLIAPRVVADAARWIQPTPSAYAFARQAQEAIDSGLDGHTSAAQRNDALKQRVLREYGVLRIEELPVSFAGISLEAGEAYTTQVYDLYYTRLWDTFDAQNRVQQAAGVFAPALAVRALSMGFAGTDFDHHRRFATAAEAYRRTLVGTMNEDMKQHAGKQDYAYRGGPALWQRVPEFSYDAPPALWALQHQVLSAGALLTWTVAAWVGLWVAGRRIAVA